MPMIPLDVEVIPEWRTRWGLVIVLNADGKPEREYTITAAECKAVSSGNNVMPPGCTREEWESGRVIVVGKALDPGQAFVNRDGSLIVNHGVEQLGAGRMRVAIREIPAGKWRDIGGAIESDAPDVAADLAKLRADRKG